MTRSRFAVVTLLATAVLGASVLTTQAQDTQKPRRRLVAPVRGEALISHTAPITNRIREEVVTTISVQNMSDRPVAGFKIEEFWYDSDDNLVPGASETIRRPLQPGEIIEITLRTPRDTRMNRNTYRFSHANGTVKNELVETLEAEEEEEEDQ